MVGRIECDRFEFLNVDFAVGGQYRFVGVYVDDFAEETAGGVVVTYYLTFQAHRQFLNHRCVHVGSFYGVETCLADFVGFLVAALDAKVVALGYVFGGCNAHRERAFYFEVGDGLVGGGEADADFCVVSDAAPCGVHCVGIAVGVIRADYQHRHRVE